jgi:hypothetical protein
MKPILSKITIRHIPDSDPDTSYLEQEGFENRLLAYRRGEFEYIGIRAEAEILTRGCYQSITSAGIWGVESDSHPNYISTLEREQLEELNGYLDDLGVERESARIERE